MNSAHRSARALALACGLLRACAAARHSPTTSPRPPARPRPTRPRRPPRPRQPPAPADARDALKKQAGDVDQATLLKETLTKTDKQYSLLRAGRVAANYDLNYSYIGNESIDVGFDTASTSTCSHRDHAGAHDHQHRCRWTTACWTT